MKNEKMLHKISQGMYVLSTQKAACFVDAVSQVGGGDHPLVSVAVMKKNYTNEVMHNTTHFAISIFGKNNDGSIIQTFGFQSSRDVDKFKDVESIEINGIQIPADLVGYMYLEKIDTIENDTHTIFIGKVIEAEQFKEDEAMTYQYYQEHKEEVLKLKTESGKTAWVCQVCGYVYYGEELPDDYECPVCTVGKSYFVKQTK